MFIRRKNCERFCFYCDLSAFVQYILSGLCNFLGSKVTAPPSPKVPVRLWTVPVF